MKTYAFRLKPNNDLKKELLLWAKTHNISAACIVTCVGSLTNAQLRLAGGKGSTRFTGPFEILSLVGTFSGEAGHFHISLADKTGQVIGGHLLEENIIFTTAEIVVLSFSDVIFKRESDKLTGYQELNIILK